MIEQQGRVLRVDGPLTWVRMGRSSGCPACEAGKGCGAGVFGKLLNRRHIEVCVSSAPLAKPGSAVLLGIPEQLFLELAWRLYGLPLLAGLGGGLATHQLALRFEPTAWLLDLAGLLGAIGAATVVFRWNARSGERLVKPNRGHEGLNSEICILEVKRESS